MGGMGRATLVLCYIFFNIDFPGFGDFANAFLRSKFQEYIHAKEKSENLWPFVEMGLWAERNMVGRSLLPPSQIKKVPLGLWANVLAEAGEINSVPYEDELKPIDGIYYMVQGLFLSGTIGRNEHHSTEGPNSDAGNDDHSNNEDPKDHGSEILTKASICLVGEADQCSGSSNIFVQRYDTRSTESRLVSRTLDHHAQLLPVLLFETLYSHSAHMFD